MAHFCTKTGARIAAPGVSKAVDPENGQDEVVERDGEEVVVKVKRAAKTEEPTGDDGGDATAGKGDAQSEGDGAKSDASESSGKGGGKGSKSGKGKATAGKGDAQ